MALCCADEEGDVGRPVVWCWPVPSPGLHQGAVEVPVHPRDRAKCTYVAIAIARGPAVG